MVAAVLPGVGAATGPNYRRGALYSLVTAFLLAVQEPFSAAAARELTAPEFIFLTQCALLVAVPLLTVSAESRRTFSSVILGRQHWGKLAVLLLVGLGGLLLYDIGLSTAHPIITAGVLDLAPFWAGLVAFVVTGTAIPGSKRLFFGCFGFAFCGAMIIAWSQMRIADGALMQDVIKSMLRGRWIYAIPMPVFFALSGTLVGKWFPGREESGVIAANFLVSAFVLIPISAVLAYLDRGLLAQSPSPLAVLMLLVGTLASSAAGRVFYQVALTSTGNDNGFVTMFFLSIPAMSALISIPLSEWLPNLHVSTKPSFFLGMLLVTAPLALFMAKTWRHGEA